MANDSELTSVALPPLGTGVLKVPVKECVIGIQKGIMKYEKKTSKKLRCNIVKICIFDEETLNVSNLLNTSKCVKSAISSNHHLTSGVISSNHL